MIHATDYCTRTPFKEHEPIMHYLTDEAKKALYQVHVLPWSANNLGQTFVFSFITIPFKAPDKSTCIFLP